MKHWILTHDRMQDIITNLDRNLMTLKAAKNYYEAYGVAVKGNTKALFIRNLIKMVQQKEYNEFYILGIKEGRQTLDKYPEHDIVAEIANLKSTIKGFPANTSVGQMLRGELDFFKNQIKIKGSSK